MGGLRIALRAKLNQAARINSILLELHHAGVRRPHHRVVLTHLANERDINARRVIDGENNPQRPRRADTGETWLLIAERNRQEVRDVVMALQAIDIAPFRLPSPVILRQLLRGIDESLELLVGVLFELSAKRLRRIAETVKLLVPLDAERGPRAIERHP